MSIQGNPFIIHDSSLVLSLDAANIKSFRGEPTTNIVPNPLDLFAWCINGATFATLSRDTSSLASPAGGIPMRMTTTGSDPYTSTYNGSSFNLSAASQGQVWTMSVWAKANRSLTCELFLFEANSSGVYINFSTVSINVTTEWQRFTLSRTNSEATVAYVQVRLDGPNTYSAGDIVWWDGLQVEQKAYATTFVSGSRGTTVETGGGLYDLTNGNNNGTLTNGPIFNAANGGSIVFDGTNDYVATTRVAGTGTATSSVTWACWCAPATVSGDIINMTSGGGWNMCPIWASGQIFYAKVWAAPTLSALSTFTLNQYYYLVLVFNYSASAAYFYINGVLQSSTTNVTYSASGVDNYLGLGLAGAQATNLYFNGKISTSHVYNKALSASEILQNYNSAKSRFAL